MFIVCYNLNIEGVSMVVDVTYSGQTEIKNITDKAQIPYLHFDYSIQSFIFYMEKYMTARYGTDIVFIFQNELRKFSQRV